MAPRLKTPGAVKAFYPMMIVPGMVLLLAPSTVESVMSYYNFRESMGGLLQVAYFTGGVLGILAITHLMRRFSVRTIVVSQVLLLSASLLIASFAPRYPLLLVFMATAGVANGILIAFPGVYVTRACGDSAHRDQSRLYTFFALGVLAGPIVATIVIGNHDYMWRWAFRVPAIIVLPLSLPLLFAAFAPLEGVERLSRRVVRDILAVDRRLFYGLFIALLLYIAAESAVSMWLITFLHEEYDVALGSAHWVLSGLWAGLTLGRWICGYASERIDPFKVLVFLTACSTVTLLAAPLTGSRNAAFVMYPLLGLFYSGIYPYLVAYIQKFGDSLSSAVFTLFVAAGALGGAVLPYFVGLVNQFSGLVAGMCSISVPMIGVLVCLLRLRKLVSRDKPAEAGGVTGSPPSSPDPFAP